MRVPAAKISLPIPDLDDKTFDELFVEARALIPRYAPEWTDHNTSDPGITFIELFAWLTEMQIYSLNRINDKNRLKYLKLLGEAPRSAKPAKVNLAFSMANALTQSVLIKKGTQTSIIDPITDQPLVFETDTDLTVTNLSIAHLFVDDTTRFLRLQTTIIITVFMHSHLEKKHCPIVLFISHLQETTISPMLKSVCFTIFLIKIFLF